MALIECKKGHAVETVGGTTYSFERDEHGRFVAEVHDLHHFKCFVGLRVYQEVQPITDEAPGMADAVKPKANAKPKAAAKPAAQTPAPLPPKPAEPTNDPATSTDDQSGGAGNQDGAGTDEAKGNAPADADTPDDLTKITGVGAVLAEKLRDLGLSRFKEIAALNEDQAKLLDTTLNTRGSVINNNWVEQAAKLHAEKYGAAE